MASSGANENAKVLRCSSWPFLGYALLVLTTQSFTLLVAAASSSSSNIALNTVSVKDQDDSLWITVTYSASPDTQPLWYMSFLTPQGFANLDFEVQNSYAGGEGWTRAKITHEEAAKQNPKTSSRLLFLRNQDCEVTVTLPLFSTLRSLSPVSEDFHGFSLTLLRGGRALEPGQDLFFRKRDGLRKIDAVLSSPELVKFEVGLPFVRHTRVEREDVPGGIPVKKTCFGHDAEDPVNVTRMYSWRGHSTRKKITFEMKNVKAVRGILKVSVSVHKTRDRATGSLVTDLSFEQNVYVSQRRHQEAIPSNTVAMKVEHSHTLSQFDAPVSLKHPELSFIAVGNPSPTITLRRGGDCEPVDAEIVETRRASKFEVHRFFRFKNATEALQGSYVVVARSGRMELREILSVGLIGR